MGRLGRARRSPGRGSVLAWGGVIGPAVFVADWAILGATRPGYSPVDDAISRLAELGASTRAEMTGGFAIYGLGLIAYGSALRGAGAGPAWLFATATGITTLGVATFPLGTPVSGTIHAVFAGLGYAALAAVPVAAAPRLAARGHRSLARLSVLTGTITGAFVLASALGAPAHGLTQRIGLTTGDIWVGASAVALLWGGAPAGRASRLGDGGRQ